MCDDRLGLAAMVLRQSGSVALPDGSSLGDAVRYRAAALAPSLTPGEVRVIDTRVDNTEIVEAIACWTLDAVPHLRPTGSRAVADGLRALLDTATIVQETSGSTGRGRLVARSPEA